MPVERQRWVPAQDWNAANARLRRVVEVLDISARVAPLVASGSVALPLTYPVSLVEVDTGAGPVALTLPSAADHPGFTVTVAPVAGSAALTVNGTPVTTPGQWVSTGTSWVRVLRDIPPVARYATVVANASGTLALPGTFTLVESDTTGGAVALTFPAPADHAGARVDVVKVAGASLLTVAGSTVTTHASWISTGAAWRRVG